MSKKKLNAAIKDYERNTGFDAINYNQLPKGATMAERIAAARCDLNWWRMHALEIEQALDRDIGKVELAEDFV